MDKNTIRFTEVQQGKYSQYNDTWGLLIPIDVLAAEVGFGHYRVSVSEAGVILGVFSADGTFPGNIGRSPCPIAAGEQRAYSDHRPELQVGGAMHSESSGT